MRLQLFAVLAAGLSLVNCSFDGGGLTGNTAVTVTNDASTTDGGTTDVEPTTTNVDPTMDAVCGNYNTDQGEQCDNGPEGNGTGGVCKADCQKNVCGDGYIANFSETCDDGNTDDGDGCNSECKSEACGNGNKEEGEECDDHNTLDNDGCTSLCRIAECGDGLKFDGVEECDDGMENADDGACTSMCKAAKCGDGLIQAGVEQCEDNNTVDDDACSNMCIMAMCGDGVVNNGEMCDDGADNADNNACKADCSENVCGDGKVEDGVEACDDPNGNADNKACKADCSENVCGDGEVEDGVEECDDGDVEDGDDCTSLCTEPACGDMLVSAGEQCDDGDMDSTDECVACANATCGDGKVWAGMEECDDDNTDQSDTCNNSCDRVAFWVFVSSGLMDGAEVMDQATMDAYCTDLAADEPIRGKYKAWLSADGTSAAMHLAQSTMMMDKKFILPDKGVVANDWADLIDGSLAKEIQLDETGALVTENNSTCNDESALVWTGTKMAGTASSSHCMDWSSNATMNVVGQAGLANKKDGTWTEACLKYCNFNAHVYCFEQP
jgi:cysteine-rich repeat protein